MLINGENKIIYIGNNQAKEFPIGYKYLDDEHLVVAIIDVNSKKSNIIEKNYYVDMEKSVLIYPGYPPGQEPPASEQPPKLSANEKLIIYRATPITQEVDLGDRHPMPTLEGMSDKLTMILQDLQEILDRCIKVDIGSDITPDQLLDAIFDAANRAENAADRAENAADIATSTLDRILELIKNNQAAFQLACMLLWLRRDNYAYNVRDLAFSVSLPSWAYLECIQAGVSASAEPSASFQAVRLDGERIIDGTVIWEVRDWKHALSLIGDFTQAANAIKQALSTTPTTLSEAITALAGNVGKKLTIQKNGVNVGVFDGKADKIINITVPTKAGDLINDSGFITSAIASYRIQVYTGSSVWTAPAGVTKVMIIAKGGGGGGGGLGGDGASGGNTYFDNLLTVGGGGGGGQAPGSGTGTGTVGAAGYSPGGLEFHVVSSFFPQYGAGGSGSNGQAGSSGSVGAGGRGGSGGSVYEYILSVTPGTSYTVTIGGGGNPHTSGGMGFGGGSPGSSGVLMIKY